MRRVGRGWHAMLTAGLVLVTMPIGGAAVSADQGPRRAAKPVPAPVESDAPTSAYSHVLAASGAAFTPLDPCRLLDTREGARPGPGGTIAVGAGDACSIPASAIAIASTLTAVFPDAPGFVTAFPGGTVPTASTLNYMPGEVRANGAIIPLAGDGTLQLYTHAATDLLLDVTGYWEDVPGEVAAGRLEPLMPTRIIDTRDVADSGRTVTVETGLAGYAAAVVNITLTATDGPMYLTAHSGAGAIPEASTVNADGAGQTRAASAFVPLTPEGTFVVERPIGWGEIIVDITGAITAAGAAASTDGLFVPVEPERLLDTRELKASRAVCLPAGATLLLDALEEGFAGAIAANVTILPAAGTGGYLTVAPDGLQGTVATSTVNATHTDVAVANLGVIQVDFWGDLGIFASHGADAIVDISGYFTGVGPNDIDPVGRADHGCTVDATWPQGPGDPALLAGVPDAEWANAAAAQCVPATMIAFVQASGYTYLEDHLSDDVQGLFGYADTNGNLVFNRQTNEAVPEEFCGTMVHETFHAIDFILAGWGPYGMSDPSYNPSYVYLDDRGDDWLVECAARASESYVLGVPPSLSYAGECGTPIPDHHTAAVEEVLALAGII